MADTDDRVTQRLRDAGLRVTSARVALIDALGDFDKPVSLDDLAESEYDDLGDRATIYRNLLALAEKEILDSVPTSGKRQLYELHPEHAHAHITCRACGATQCIDAPLKSAQKIKVKGWTHTHANMSYWGICSACSA